MSQYPTVVFADAVEVVIAALLYADVPDGSDTFSRVPSTRPDRFTTVQRTGGPRKTRFHDGPQITVDSWGADEGDAHDLAQRNRAVLNSLPGQTWGGAAISHVEELAGPGWLPDPLSDHARYSQTFVLTLRPAP